MRYNSCFWLFCGLLVGCSFAPVIIDVIAIVNPPVAVEAVSEAPVTVDASRNLTYRPIRVLGNDWYLVEIAYPHTCENPFPFGKTMMVMVVPHLVRMHASELDKMAKIGSLLVIPSELNNPKNEADLLC